MTRPLLVFLALFFAATAAHAQAQVPSPAQMGMTPTSPQVLQTLDSSKTWVPIGTVGGGVFNLFPAPVVADGYVSADAAMASGSSTLTVASRSCSAADAGKIVVVSGAGTAQAPLKTTVTSCSGASYVLGAGNASGGAVSAMQWGLGTDYSAALNAAVVANPNAEITLPFGIVLLDATTVALNKIKLRGRGVLADRTAAFGQNANQGTTFLLTSPTVQPFTVNKSVTISGVNFFWPGQAGVTVNPVAYPPLISDNGTSSLSDFVLENSSVINAYDFFVQNPTANVVMGRLQFNNDNFYAVRNLFSLSSLGEVFSLNNVLSNSSVYASVANSGNQYLGKWTQANGVVFNITGNGTPTTCANSAVNLIVNNSVFYIDHYFIKLTGGKLTESQFGASVDVGATPQLFYVDASSVLGRVAFNGRAFLNPVFGVIVPGAGLDFEGTCGPATNSNDITVVGAQFWAAQNDLVDINGTNMTVASFVGTGFDNSLVPSGSPLYLVNVNNPNTRIGLVGDTFYPATAGTNSRGVLLQQAAAVTITGNNFRNLYNAVDWTSLPAGVPLAITGNTSSGTFSTTTVTGPFSVWTTLSGNLFDKPVSQAASYLPQTITVGQGIVLGGGITASGSASFAGMPASAGSGGLFVCVDSVGVLYKKATCP